MKENTIVEFVNQLIAKGVNSIMPNSVEEALLCAFVDKLPLSDLSNLQERTRNVWKDTLIDYLAPEKDSFTHFQERYEMLGAPTDSEFFKLLKNKGFCSDCLFMNRKFDNPFPEETLKYSMFQGSLAEWLIGMYKIEDLELRCTPTLPFTALIMQMEIIQRELLDFDNSDKILFDIRETLRFLPIFLVTRNLEGKEHEIINPFDRKKHIGKIPKSRVICEGGSDALGRYVSDYGCIYLWVDKIYSYRVHPLIFQKVLLHELIHFLFDIVRRSAVEERDNKKDNEETLDNFLVLLMYKNAISPIIGSVEHALADIEDFISSQPYHYRNAINEYKNNSDWFSAREKIYNFLK